MRAYFTTKKDSLYFESESFNKILNYLKNNFSNCKMEEKYEKLIFILKEVKSVSDAIRIFKNILKKTVSIK